MSTNFCMQKSGKVFISRQGSMKTFVVRKKKKAIKYNDYAEFEQKLAKVAGVVEAINFKVANGLEDGRVVSWRNEHKIVDILLDTFDWVYGKNFNRDTGDIYIKTANFHFPVNIKLIRNNAKSYNNICGLTHNISRLLYGEVAASKVALAEMIKANGTNFTEEPQQYGILAVNKGTGHVKYATLFNINDLYINPTNGFQFSFEKMHRVKRSQKQGQEFLLEAVRSFFEAQALPYMVING